MGQGTHISLPTAWAINLNCLIISLKTEILRDCSPSERAFSGFGWISTSIPSAPAATAARAIGVTRSHFPTPWLGSTITGKCDAARRRYPRYHGFNALAWLRLGGSRAAQRMTL